MDIEMVADLKQGDSSCKVIMLMTFARLGYFERAVKAGVHGYLLKDGFVDDLAESIRRVMRRLLYNTNRKK